MAACDICTKAVAVSLYFRIKPMMMLRPGKYAAIKESRHLFLGYWPPESHLAQYLQREYGPNILGKHDPILQRLWESNCHGHTLDEVVEAIEQKMPPVPPALAIKILWNPSPRVTPYLLAETYQQREDLKISINNDLRWSWALQRSEIRQRVLGLLNNAVENVPASISYPGAPVTTLQAPLAGQPVIADEAVQARIRELEAQNSSLLAALSRQIDTANNGRKEPK